MADNLESQGDKGREQSNFSPAGLNGAHLLEQQAPLDKVTDSQHVPKYESAFSSTRMLAAEPNAALQHEASTMNFKQTQNKMVTKVA